MRRILLLSLLASAAGCVSAPPKVVVVHRDRYIPRPAAQVADEDQEVDRELDQALAREWPEPTEGSAPPPRERVRGETDRVLYVTPTPVVVLGTNSGYRARSNTSVTWSSGYGSYYGGAVNYGTTYLGHGRGRGPTVYGGVGIRPTCPTPQRFGASYSSPRVSVQYRPSCPPTGGVRVGVRFR